MKIKTDFDSNPNLSIALGFFDGVHQAHQVVISNAVFYAQELGLKSAVVTFKDHPIISISNKKPKYITSLDKRLELIEKLGVDFAYVIDFNEKIMGICAEDYLNNFLVKNFRPKAITTGFNHNFGVNKQGDCTFLKRNEAKYGYKFFEIPPIAHNGQVISSTKIRELLMNCDFDIAKSLLGHAFSIESNVISGNKIGTKLGFATANLIYPDEILKIPTGVYATTVILKNAEYEAVMNYGNRPTVEVNTQTTLEVHILDFKGDIYGEKLTVIPLSFLRDEKKFKTFEELQTQICRDIEQAKQFDKTIKI